MIREEKKIYDHGEEGEGDVKQWWARGASVVARILYDESEVGKLNDWGERVE
jgi:hypothetical protein